jgi:hypothetical protein
MGKGSSRRPASVPPETVAANYERTFGPQDRYAPPGVRYVTMEQLSDSALDFTVVVHSDTIPSPAPSDVE